MDKASSALRRSSVKLMSFGNGHGDLQMIISQLRDVKASSRTFAAAQEAAMQDMFKWAMRDENRAIQDSVCQVCQLHIDNIDKLTLSLLGQMLGLAGYYSCEYSRKIKNVLSLADSRAPQTMVGSPARIWREFQGSPQAF